MPERPTYTEIEHTADVGVELEAPDLDAAFERVAAAMFDMISDLDRVGSDWRRDVRVVGRSGDREHLLIRWLAELLFLHESEHVLLSTFHVERIGPDAIEAEVAGERIDRERHALKVEIKAPTYHDLVIEETASGWRVRVIFDT
jgi:SHS2 domain-containing protein